MAGFRIEGNTSGNVVEVAGTNQLKIIPETNASANAANIGGVRNFSEIDQGLATGSPYLVSPEVDDDFRTRAATDILLDDENFNYALQNTGKHTTNAAATTFVPTWTVGAYNTNSTALTTASAAVSFGTYAEFPILATATLALDIEASFSNTAVTNTSIDFGFFRNAITAPFAPTDGVYFRFSASGLTGVVNYNGTETTTSPFNDSTGAAWVPTINRKYQFILYVTPRDTEFWINDNGNVYLLGSVDTPVGNGQPCASSTLPVRVRHAIAGSAASAGLSLAVSRYSVRLGGPTAMTTLSTQGSRLHGSYQGLSGGTMGSLATYVNSTNPTAAAPSNTALTANLPGGLGGQGLVTAAAAAATDGIWSEYGVPAGTISILGKRLVLRGVKLDLVNLGAAVATTATTIQFSIAFGHTAVSLATTESGFAKAPRRIPLGIATWAIGAAIGQQPQSGPIVLDLGDAPALINPGERVALVGKFLVGTATASQTIGFVYTPIYGWE
jgi:hypothetical protein